MMQNEFDNGTDVFWKKSSDYEDHFEPDAYYKTYLSTIEAGSYPEKLIKDFHEIFSKVTPTGPRLLDVGTGPSIHSVISASRVYTEIFLSDYTTKCRESLERWARKSSEANDWSHCFKVVGQLEDKPSGEIEERLRSRIKEIIHCDVLSETVISPDHGLFDGITSSACLESSSLDYAVYKQNVKRLWSLLKPGGVIAVFGFMEFKVYQVGEKMFSGLCLNRGQVEEAFQEAGFEGVVFTPMVFSEEMREHYGGEESAGKVFTLNARRGGLNK